MNKYRLVVLSLISLSIGILLFGSSQNISLAQNTNDKETEIVKLKRGNSDFENLITKESKDLTPGRNTIFDS